MYCVLDQKTLPVGAGLLQDMGIPLRHTRSHRDTMCIEPGGHLPDLVSTTNISKEPGSVPVLGLGARHYFHLARCYNGSNAEQRASLDSRQGGGDNRTNRHLDSTGYPWLVLGSILNTSYLDNCFLSTGLSIKTLLPPPSRPVSPIPKILGVLRAHFLIFIHYFDF